MSIYYGSLLAFADDGAVDPTRGVWLLCFASVVDVSFRASSSSKTKQDGRAARQRWSESKHAEYAPAVNEWQTVIRRGAAAYGPYLAGDSTLASRAYDPS